MLYWYRPGINFSHAMLISMASWNFWMSFKRLHHTGTPLLIWDFNVWVLSQQGLCLTGLLITYPIAHSVSSSMVILHKSAKFYLVSHKDQF